MSNTKAYDAQGKGRSTFTVHKERVFYDVMDLHRATLIQLVKVGTIDAAAGKKIAKGLAQAIASYDDPTDPASLDYLLLEGKLLELVGPTASFLHTGRSRQDITSTLCQMEARHGARVSANAMLKVRESLLQVAEKHIMTVIPAYTHGVPAQPTTFAHYLLSFHDSMERHYHRMEEAYSRANQAALGSDVMCTSRFRHDRHLAAALLGFDGPVENSFDAVHGHAADVLCEVSQNMSLVSVLLSRYMMDMNVWQMTAHPWIYMSPSKLMSVSSSMPQKRNPRAMEWVRSMGAIISGQSETFLMAARNQPTGMSDIRDNMARIPDEIMVKMLGFVSDIVLSLAINVERAREETAKDYSTMIDVAESLYVKGKVPFRIGHHLASLMTDYGRENGLYPYQISYAEAERMYKSISDGQELPISEADYKDTLDPVEYIKSRRGIGGPQEAEVKNMIAERKSRLASDQKKANTRNKHLTDAKARCLQEFEELQK
jgi:argininosuccinate lyase